MEQDTVQRGGCLSLIGERSRAPLISGSVQLGVFPTTCPWTADSEGPCAFGMLKRREGAVAALSVPVTLCSRICQISRRASMSRKKRSARSTDLSTFPSGITSSCRPPAGTIGVRPYLRTTTPSSIPQQARDLCSRMPFLPPCRRGWTSARCAWHGPRWEVIPIPTS